MNELRYFKLKNKGAFVARMRILWNAVDDTGKKYSGEYEPSGYHDICAEAERIIDLTDANIPNGAEVYLKAIVVMGKDNTASERYIYQKNSAMTASYEISKTTLNNKLELVSYK